MKDKIVEFTKNVKNKKMKDAAEVLKTVVDAKVQQKKDEAKASLTKNR